MEASHHAPGPIGGNARSGFKIFRKARVKGGCEGPTVAQAKGAHSPTKRPFSRNMHNLRPEIRDKLHKATLGSDREPNFSVAGGGHTPKTIRADNLNGIATGP